jgi:hypothetical protein
MKSCTAFAIHVLDDSPVPHPSVRHPGGLSFRPGANGRGSRKKRPIIAARTRTTRRSNPSWARALSRNASDQQRRIVERRLVAETGADRNGAGRPRADDPRQTSEGADQPSAGIHLTVARSGLLAERIVGPSLSGVSLHSCGHPSSGELSATVPEPMFNGWQRADPTASIALWLSPATHSTVPAGTA